MPSLYDQFHQNRPRVRPSSLALPIAILLLLMMFLVGIGYYYSEPAANQTGTLEPEPGAAAGSFAAVPTSMPDEFAIEVKNEVLGGPFAVPEGSPIAGSEACTKERPC